MAADQMWAACKDLAFGVPHLQCGCPTLGLTGKDVDLYILARRQDSSTDMSKGASATDTYFCHNVILLLKEKSACPRGAYDARGAL